ncbi:hypothetical protein SAMN05421736_10270 [Evansella caseinilytica]|uniref:RNA polymerase subunit sigma-70 n=1 Tax=Evansella caseinilytica TaxID=1503961 RepID=A0A1H3K7B6_9BACI|nr:hypothetical protein [Evansella caseinilytica]SDY48086.1 hypothetical protein SAMN05421736_10270 [Evansella caseinilytica]
MRTGHQQERFIHSASRLMDVNLHRFSEIDETADNYEIAAEFGLSLKEVKALKKRMERN